MPSSRHYREDRHRLPPSLPALPRRSESIGYASPPPPPQQPQQQQTFYTSPAAVASAAYNHPPVVPEPALHKVWIIDCKNCGTFLTNRAMKASVTPALAENLCL